MRTLIKYSTTFLCLIIVSCLLFIHPHHSGPLRRQACQELQKYQHPTNRLKADVRLAPRDAQAPKLERGVRHHQHWLRHPRTPVLHTLLHCLYNPFNHTSCHTSQSRRNARRPVWHDQTGGSIHPLGAQGGDTGVQHLQ